MDGIFLSYRRDGSRGSAGRLYENLRTAFGQGAVFKDVDSVDIGVDFRAEIERAIDGSAVMVAVIGPEWLPTDPAAPSRLDEPGDFVRIEIEQALKSGIAIIPVLVDGATVPVPSRLPETIRPLAFINAASIDHDSWDRDCEGVIEAVRGRIEQRRVDAAARARAEAEAAARAEQDARRRAEDEARRQAEQLDRRRRAEEAQRQALAAAGARAERDAQARAEEAERSRAQTALPSLRVMSRLIDAVTWVAGWLVAVFLSTLIEGDSAGSEPSPLVFGLVAAGATVVALALEVAMPSATIGKRIVGLRVVAIDTAPTGATGDRSIDRVTATKRFGPYLLVFALMIWLSSTDSDAPWSPLISLLLMLTSGALVVTNMITLFAGDDARTFADRLAHTRVVLSRNRKS